MSAMARQGIRIVVCRLARLAGSPRVHQSFIALQPALYTSNIFQIMCRVEKCKTFMLQIWLLMPAAVSAGRWEPAEAAFTAALAAAAPGADQGRQVCYLAACRLLQASPSQTSPRVSCAFRFCHVACHEGSLSCMRAAVLHTQIFQPEARWSWFAYAGQETTSV